jgi:hypothetical protein
MTINKAQGQTIPTVGIYLPEPVFSHGQLYVALSRGVSRQTTRILAKPNKDIDPTGKSTKNIVYRDVLEETSKFFFLLAVLVLISYWYCFISQCSDSLMFMLCSFMSSTTQFKSDDKKHPMQVHDAILHRSRG